MKLKEDRPFATPEAAVRKLLEIANGIEADHAGRLAVEAINKQFKDAGGSYAEYGAAMKAAIAHGYPRHIVLVCLIVLGSAVLLELAQPADA
jgi:hypothetical protein